MLRGIPALLSVLLWFVCQPAVTPQHVDIRCSRDIFKRVSELLIKAPSQISLRLYTPTSRDFEICPGAALRCFAEELNVLAEEWELNWTRRNKLSSRILKQASLFNQAESECRQCELLKEENAETFLRNLTNTLQNMNAQFCPPTRVSTKGF
uniref:Interleukin n=1 Tax=Stegastes partitus TaxID=144197 RepID=A0A3B5AK64_9TELE